MWKCQFCEKMNFDDQTICPYCNAPNPAGPPPKSVDPKMTLTQPVQSGPYAPPQDPAGRAVPGAADTLQRAKRRDSIITYLVIGAAIVSVLLMLTVLIQKRSGRRASADDVALVTPTPTMQESAFAAAMPVSEGTPMPTATAVPEEASEPVVAVAAADVYLGFGETYQCSTADFVLPHQMDESSIVWSCDANETGTDCTASGLITGGNTQVDVEKEFSDPIRVVGTTPDGSELSYNVIIGDGKTYAFTWSSGRRNMKNYNGSVILVSPMILNCDGFSIYYEYELTKGSLKSDNWSVWVRENGTDWIRVQDIVVKNQVGEVYDIVFDEPVSFSEICVQPETYSDSFSYNNSFAVGYLIFH